MRLVRKPLPERGPQCARPGFAHWEGCSQGGLYGAVRTQCTNLSHFVNSGTKEAGASKQTFDVRAYKGKNADLARAFGNDWKSYYRYYAQHGVNEHRACA